MKVTKATLKKYARQNKLFGKIKSSFDGMIDGFSNHQKQMEFSALTVEDIDRMWCSWNLIDVDGDNIPCNLYNCCYNMELSVK